MMTGESFWSASVSNRKGAVMNTETSKTPMNDSIVNALKVAGNERGLGIVLFPNDDASKYKIVLVHAATGTGSSLTQLAEMVAYHEHLRRVLTVLSELECGGRRGTILLKKGEDIQAVNNLLSPL